VIEIMKKACFSLFAAIVFCVPAIADEPATRQALRKRIDSYVDAFNKGDSSGVAGHWAQGAEYVNHDTGETAQGREAIEKMFARQFSQTGPLILNVTIHSIRFIAPQVAIEEGMAHVKDSKGDQAASNYHAVHVHRDGDWYLDSVRETAGPYVPQPHRELSKLSWLIGEWVDEGSGVSVQTKNNWTANKHFITRKFKVQIAGQLNIQGTEIIGWDPASERLRSWVFDTDGAFGEGTWRQDGDQWIVQATGVLSDGRRGAHVRVLTRTGNDSYTTQTVTRELDGNLLPNIEEFTVHRVVK
jgi:uncharacterized protein (TIGR02246 family)